MSFSEKYGEYLNYFNSKLLAFCDKLDCKPDILRDSIKYSLLLNGKRIRPVLMLAVADLLNVEREKVINFALAIELIHTYSLIHDDLPEMDNDDFRRGKPSNHKVFGTGNAVLAGDGLLNTAYSLLISECFKGNEFVSASKFICDSAGIYGMIGGQSADLLYENSKEINEDALDFIYENKTAKLIIAPIIVPSILCEGKHYSKLKLFGKELGMLFQFKDDVLDVEGNFDAVGKTCGKDEKEGKLTAIKLFGLDGCKLKCDLLADSCLKILEGINGDIEFLRDFVNFSNKREN